MARIRTIKPEFWTDSKVVGLSPLARLLFIGAWNFADDYGAVPADPLQLKLKVLPAEPCNADDLVDELLKAEVLVEATNGTETFWLVRSWEKHQKVDRRSSSRYGDPETWTLVESHRTLDEPRRIPPSTRDGREGKGGDQGREKQPLSVPDGTDDRFEEFWDAYPRHHETNLKGGGGNKKTTRRRFGKLKRSDQDEVLAAVRPYAAVCGPGGRFPKNAERFLTDEFWKTYLDMPDPADDDEFVGGVRRIR